MKWWAWICYGILICLDIFFTNLNLAKVTSLWVIRGLFFIMSLNFDPIWHCAQTSWLYSTRTTTPSGGSDQTSWYIRSGLYSKHVRYSFLTCVFKKKSTSITPVNPSEWSVWPFRGGEKMDAVTVHDVASCDTASFLRPRIERFTGIRAVRRRHCLADHRDDAFPRSTICINPMYGNWSKYRNFVNEQTYWRQLVNITQYCRQSISLENSQLTLWGWTTQWNH